jgi:hypothetical protein
VQTWNVDLGEDCRSSSRSTLSSAPTRRCRAFAQLDCLHKPEQWPGLKSLAVVESQHEINGKTTLERRL